MAVPTPTGHSARPLVLRSAVAGLDATLEELRRRDDVLAQDLAAAAEPGEHVEDLFE